MNVVESEIDKIEIGYFNRIWPKVKIGDGTKIGSYCELETGCVIGANCIIQGRVRIGPYAIIEQNVIIKYGTILTDYVEIKSNTFIGPNVITLGAEADRVKRGGTIIGSKCFIGAGAKIKAGIHICDHVIIGANSFVSSDITEPGIYAGSPVRKIK